MGYFSAEPPRRTQTQGTPQGRFLAFEPHASSNLEDNVAHPLAPYMYSVSTLHFSLAHDGAGLGTVWGQQKATQMLLDAGFSEVGVREVPNEPVNALYVARR
ncbi:MAG: hypothetical protein M3O70_12670 [Actinomycetota bacterium]|nr:hypothetical protein [Actinomycetota bacterium]